ncbi:Six-hairpin glycosidase [Sistotremastrum suecicum HHB10207 ss-3]|uniref:Six-hairpin glycosidase n=1 Tax=Sistotremastrum suecicum HHB10207 ss-3 TaxID=1314776 RepID=A0A166FZM3_9AGAM|nr:Six-hairpin glycosidase [Sistotremastrum suecicum HHB10207 ss-3]
MFTISRLQALATLPWLVISLSVLGAASPTLSTGLSVDQISKVRAQMLNLSTQSWELGTASEVLLELEWPALSVFGASPFPPPIQLDSSLNLSDVLAIAANVVNNRPTDTLELVNDGAVGDPASLGVAVLLANWTRTNRSDNNFASAAGSELSYVLNVAPRAPDGAISHRSDQVQLWADFIYMAPPFIAYFGVLQGGDDELGLLQEAYTQCSLYRDNLQDPETKLWQHIGLGDWQDPTLWATGNGWAAAGMLRVLETIRKSTHAKELEGQSKNLTQWIDEIVTAAWTFQQSNGTLLNSINDNSSFADSSGTALIASATYRLALITNDTSHIPAANKAFTLIQNSLSDDGLLENVVDPLTFNSPGTISPEGQSFVLLLQTAWWDWYRSTQVKSAPALSALTAALSGLFGSV